MLVVAGLTAPIVLTDASVADAGSFTVGRLLNQLPVRKENNAGYDRDKFAGWLDRDHDGCDTRAEVLIR